MARRGFESRSIYEQQAYDQTPQGQAELAARSADQKAKDAERERQAQINAQNLVETGRSGDGGRLLPGTTPPNFGGSIYGGNDDAAYDADVNRDRQMGAESNSRAAVTLDQTNANQSRGFQMGALGLMGSAARGQAPSRAAELGSAATDNAARGSLAGMAGARGPGAAVAGANAAGAGASGRMVAANAAVGDLRAAEMQKNQAGYAAGAQGVEGQDIAAATTNAQLEAQQRALNEQRQQGFERRGWNVRNMQQGAADRHKRNTDDALNLVERQNIEKQARDSAQARELYQMTTSTVSGLAGAAGSDERIKRDIHPVTMGSLSGLSRFMHGGRR